MRARFDAEYIRSELERIGQQLDSAVTVFLIGGGAMAFRDLKTTTKDIDLVVASGEDLRRVQETLLELGYEVVQSPAEEYEQLGAQRILENNDGCRIDLFNRQVIDKLVLSEGIKERSDRQLEAGNLVVQLVSSEDIFLFKAVAGRADDIDDMFTLVQTDLDFESIEDELTAQIRLLDQELFVTHLNEALIDLTDRHDIRTPLHEPVAEITDRVYEELHVLQELGEESSMTELETAVDLEADKTHEIVERLEQKGAIATSDSRIERLSDSI